MQVGEYRKAKAAFRRCLELTSPDHAARPSMRQFMDDCDKRSELEARLPEVLAGKVMPADAAEQAAFARVCAEKSLYAASAHLFETAFRARPQLAEDLSSNRRYTAARAAAMAGCGRGNDGNALTDTDRARLRGLARIWLQAELTAWKALETPSGRARAKQQLLLMQRSPDFTGVRDAEPLTH